MITIKGFISIGFITLMMIPLVQAQIVIQADALPSAGDTINRMSDNLPSQIEVGQPGGDQVWDFTSLQAPFTVSYSFEAVSSDDFPEANLVLDRNGINTFYKVTDSSSEILGTQGGQGGMGLLSGSYDPPLMDLEVPLEYQDANSQFSELISNIDVEVIPDSILALLPVQPDSLRLILSINRNDVVDAWGTVLMQHQAFDVLRQRRIEEGNLQIQARVLPLPWVDITDLILQLLPFPIPVSDTTISYRYLTADLSVPVAEVFTDLNDVPIRVEFEADQFSATRTLERKARGVYVYPNPTLSGIVRFEFFNLPPDYYQLKVYNVLGKELWAVSEYINTNKVLQADLSRLKRGTYFYSLLNSRGKRITTRRLVRITP